MKTIYIDLDGVLVDFDNMFKDIIGARPENSNRDDHYKNFCRFVEQRGFAKAAVIDNAKQFVKAVVERCYETGDVVKYLTSDGSIKELREEVMKQKIEWLQNNGLWLGSNNFILSHGWRGKLDYANKNTILFDDSDRNVSHFTQSGGTAVLYNPADYQSSLQQLVVFTS